MRLLNQPGPSQDDPWLRIFRASEGYLLRFPDLADFAVSADGGAVRCWPAIGVSEVAIEHLYLNQVLPLALSRRGRLVFHASAVEIGGKAVAFMGESGRGKSTLAASFAISGARFLTDDGLFASSDVAGVTILPGHPSIRLWDDSERAVVGVPVPKAPALDFTDKGRLLSGEAIAHCDTPLALRRIYFLGNGAVDTAVIEPLAQGAAFIELVRHSFLLDIEEPALLASHFDGLAELARVPGCYRLDFPRRFEELASVRHAIARHLLDEDV